MLVIYEDTHEMLTVRTSRLAECVGLFFCGIGLLSLSVPLLTLDKSIELTISGAGLFNILYYGITFGVAGIIMVFQQRKYLFYIPDLKVICWEGMRQTREMPFSEIAQVEIAYAQFSERGLLSLITTAGGRMLLTRGPRTDLFPLATRISQVTGAPLNSTQIVPEAK
jgi:hypothetical protein